MPVREEVRNWIDEALSDLKGVEACLRYGVYNWACFIAQQAVEKALKALVLHVLGEYFRTHDLVRLYRYVRGSIDLSIDERGLARLSMYYIQARYPNAGIERPSQEITKEEAEEMFNIARDVINKIIQVIRDP